MEFVTEDQSLEGCRCSWPAVVNVDSRRPTYRTGNLLATGVQKEKRQDNWFPGMDSMD